MTSPNEPQVYRVEVEERRRAVLFIEAHDPEEAEETAQELYQDFIEAGIDVDADARLLKPGEGLEPGELVWVGGEDGDFQDLKRYLQGER